MHTTVECVSCGEIPQTLSTRVDGEEVGGICIITLYPGLLSVCLNPWVCRLHISSLMEKMPQTVQSMSMLAIIQNTDRLHTIFPTTGNKGMFPLVNSLAGAGIG